MKGNSLGLHEAISPKVGHQISSPKNILLDDEFNAKLSDDSNILQGAGKGHITTRILRTFSPNNTLLDDEFNAKISNIGLQHITGCWKRSYHHENIGNL
ncbi:hypothetical protein Tco_0448078 [Tanacetum coccineum]